MHSDGTAIEIRNGKKWSDRTWCFEAEHKTFRDGKCYVCCICPKCDERHNVYMLWTGRGVPRKYCGGCKPLVSGYDEAAIYEAAVYFPNHSKKKRRHNEGE